MKLSQSEINSALWAKLTEYTTDRLQALREKNDGRLSESETSRLRGQISEIQVFDGLGKPEPSLIAENGDE